MANVGSWLRDTLRWNWQFAVFYLLPVAGLTFGLGFAVGATGSPGTRALEGCLLALEGSLLARFFIGLLVGRPRDPDDGRDLSRCICIFIGFFLSPVVLVIELILLLITRRRILLSATGLVWMATIVGGFTGFMDGVYRVHRASGAFPFPMDITWGLSGATNATTLHVANIIAGQHRMAATAIPVTRQDSHQYDVGFYFKASAAFTQGNVMSNMGGKDGVFWHELAHTYQNRIAGPWFTLGYLIWMLVSLLPALFVGLVTGNGGDGIYAWCYADNPYEALGYAIGGNPGIAALLKWSLPMWIGVSIPFYLHGIALLVRAGLRVWKDNDIFRLWNLLEPMRCILPAVIAMGNLTIWMKLVPGTGGEVIGWIVATIGWLSCFLPIATDAFANNIVTRVYKLILGWTSWLMPMCWPCHALGLLMFLLNLIGIRGLRFDWRTASVQSVGGWIGNLFTRGFTIGGFSVVSPNRLTDATLYHEAGHALNHAAFAFMHLGHILRFAGRDNTWIKMAESHVPYGLRNSGAYDQGEDWPRLRMWGPGVTEH